MEKLEKLLESTEIDINIFLTLVETYEQLKLKNVPLPDDIQVKVESKLIEYNFITKSTKTSADSFEHIKRHLDFTCFIIDQFLLKYSNKELEVDLEYVFRAKYIAQNISVLKRRIEYTYEILPWEEMQFCLVMYFYSLTKRSEADIVCNLVLDKNRVFKHLSYFYIELKKVQENFKEEHLLLKLNKSIPRNLIKNTILKQSLGFKLLYEDFTILRNVYSLTKIKGYLEQALSVNITQNTVIAQLVIERSLQVMGEYLKNTIESPNLSDDLYKFLIRSAPRNLRSILVNVRNMLSHAFSLSRKLELESSKDVNFFKNVQTDLSKVLVEIVYMLYQQKINSIKMFLIKILNNHNLNDIKYIFKEADFKEIETVEENYLKFDDVLKARELIYLFCEKVSEKSDEDNSLIEEVKIITESYKTKINFVSSNFSEGVKKLLRLQQTTNNLNTLHNMARTYLVTITASQPQSLFNKVFKKLHLLYLNFKTRRNYDENNFLEPDDDAIKLGNIIIEIYNHLKWGMHRIKWIEEIENTLTFKIDVDPEKIEKINNILRAVENKLEEDKDKEIVHNAVLQKTQVHIAKAEINNYFDKSAETFGRILKSLNLGKCEEVILNSFEKKKFDRLQRQIKKINDDYGILTKQLRDIFPLETYINALKTFYNKLKLKKPLQIKVLKAVHDLVQEKVIYSYGKRLEVLKNILENVTFLKLKDNKFLITAVEMLVLDLTEYLVNVKLLGDNKLFLIESLPILKGKQLRNYLAHGDILTDILPFNPLISITFHAKKLVELGKDILYQTDLIIGCKITSESLNMQDYFEKCLNSIKSQEMLFEYIRSTNGAKLEIVKSFFKSNEAPVDTIYKCLKIAVISGQFILMKHIICEFTVDINYKYENDMTLLHFALKYSHTTIANYLIRSIVDDQITTNETKLLLALESKRLELVTYLLDINAGLINTFISNKTTALHTAVQSNFAEAVNILLERNANPYTETKDGQTAFELAAQYGYKNILKILLEQHSQDLSSKLLTRVALLAAENGHLHIFWKLLYNTVNTNIFDGKTILHRSAFYGHYEDVAILIKNKIGVNSGDNNGCTALHLACQCGHIQVINILLESGADINSEDNNKWSALHWATQYNHLNVVQLLLSKNSKGEMYDKNGKTAFHLAAENCFADIFTILLDYTGDVNIKTENGQTALHLAAENGHDEIINILLNVSDTDINAKTENDETPLILAAIGGHYNVIETLLKHGATVNNKTKKEGYTALSRAANQGYTDIVTILLENKADKELSDKSGWRAFHFAVQNGYTDILEIFLKEGVDINSKYTKNGTALLTAVRNGHKDIVKKLIESGADIHTMMYSILPLRVAANFGYQDIILMLLNNGADINATGNDGVSPLHPAAWNGHKEVVDLLIKNGADVNKTNEEQWTALHFAAKFGHSNIVKSLVEAGANIYSKNNFGATVFHIACEMGYVSIVTMLLERYNVDVNIKNKDGWTGLHWASGNGHIKVVETLVQHNATVNIKANDESTPLHWAVQYTGSLDIVNILIKNNAEVNATDAKGSTPLLIASLNGHKNIVEILLQNYADVSAENNKNTALHLAATFGYHEIIQILLDKGANVNDRDMHKKTGLHISAQKGYTAIVCTLLKKGALINIRDVFGMTPLHLATENGHKNIVHYLIKAHAEINTKSCNGYTPLYSAIVKGHKDIAASLIENNADINTKTYDQCTYLHLAIKKGMMKVVSALIKRGVNLNVEINKVTPLMKSICADHEDISVLLIENNADINTQTYDQSTYLHLAIKKGMIKVVLALIHRGVNLNVQINNVTPLMESICADQEDIALLLIQYNANINIATSDGWTSLHLAAGKGCKKVFDSLVKGAVNINAKTRNGETALYFASLQGHYDIVSDLLKNNADINVQAISNGWSALSVAAQEGHTQIIKLLIDHNADVNVKGDQHLTPLHLSVLHEHEESVQMLLKQNANVLDKTDSSWTPLHIAASDGYTSIVKLLLENSIDNINDTTDKGATPLLLAVEQGNKNVVEVLLEYKANIQLTGNDVLTLVELATQKGFTDIAEIILQHTRNVNPKVNG